MARDCDVIVACFQATYTLRTIFQFNLNPHTQLSRPNCPARGGKKLVPLVRL